MSSGDDDGLKVHAFSEHDYERPDGKRRKLQRACDFCRSKKIRCDSASMPGNRCSNCVAASCECTYVEIPKRRAPPKGYVESLESRLEKMENLLNKMCPTADVTQELDGTLNGAYPKSKYSGRESPLLNGIPVSVASCSGMRSPALPDTPDEDELDPSDDEVLPPMLVEGTKRIRLDPLHPRFIGKSSGIHLLKTALDMKSDYGGETRTHMEENKQRFLSNVTQAWSDFWRPKSYELPMFEDTPPRYSFPPPDLIASLVGLYFQHVNHYTPLLHRPTFERNVREGLHHREDDGFGGTLLLVCAIASKYSDDERVFLDGNEGLLSAGWKWFNQVQVARKPLLAPPSLSDLQAYALGTIFLYGSSSIQACWTMVGIGIRLVQGVGAHRRRMYRPELNVEDELWKRACWVLVYLDRMISATLGRPCALQDEDFDLDLPADCDDEYWENEGAALAFKQPEGKPSSMSYFICRIKLDQVLAFALRTIYSLNRSKVLLGFVGPEWEKHIVAQLDSALNRWIDAVPDHLRWDPKREHQLFLNQSVLLYGEYYNLQIIVHRPFISSPRKPSALSFPSMAICTNAARSLSHVIDVARRRGDEGALPALMFPAFTASIVLLLNIWGGKCSGVSSNVEKEMADVHMCVAAMKVCERRWDAAARMREVLCDLASAGDLPLPQHNPGTTFKRERDSDDSMLAYQPARTAPSANSAEHRTIAGSRRVLHANAAAAAASTSTPPAPADLYALPLYSEDLRRMPLHPPASDAQSPFTSAWYGGVQPEHTGPAPMAAFDMSPPVYDQTSSLQVGQSGSGAGVDGFGAYMPLGAGMGVMDASDMGAMWNPAPSGFEWDDWGPYFATATQQGQGPRQ